MGNEDRLAEYRAKRDPERTPEPFGAGAVPKGCFVVQKHGARRLHYDLRLEIGGVLASWAVPKPPSLDPAVKRLAVPTEDHPLGYADFEGVIPEGYGAGAMIVWDRGRWRPREDPEAGLRDGKLVFELEGRKLRGQFVLVKTGSQWLLKKKQDAFARAGAELPETSVRSGLELEGLEAAAERARTLPADVADAPETTLSLFALSPMLAETAAEPFDDQGWLFELKYDGFRLLAEQRPGRARLRYRSGREATRSFPELEAALSALPYRGLVVDGEVVVLDESGAPALNLLQQRAQLDQDREVDLARWRLPAVYMVFDLIAAEGRDLRSLPIERRKELLKSVLPKMGPLRYVDHLEAEGRGLFDAVRERGLEGIVGKRLGSPYREARSPDWLKVRCERTEAFAIIGFTPPKGSRVGFGGLHLARPTEDKGWKFVGRVGSGFSGSLLESLSARLAPLVMPKPVCPVEGADRASIWVRPEVVVEVTYLTESEDGHIRQSRFRDLREEPASMLVPGVELPSQDETRGQKISLSNPKKIFFPGDGFTKKDLADYHQRVAERILPYLIDREIAFERFPDGIEGKSFFQKHALPNPPSWLRTARVRDHDAFVLDDERGLLYLINLGVIPLHIGTARLSALGRPDYLVLDLDPKEATFSQVVEVAHAARRLAEEVGLSIFAKTSGSSGLHLLVPLGALYDHEQAKTLARLLVRLIETRHPNLCSVDRNPARRGHRVGLDLAPNGAGKLMAAPYTVRPHPGAPVSTPLRWEELDKNLDPRQWNIRSVPSRLGEPCPLAGALGPGPDLDAVLPRLATALGINP